MPGKQDVLSKRWHCQVQTAPLINEVQILEMDTGYASSQLDAAVDILDQEAFGNNYENGRNGCPMALRNTVKGAVS